MADEIFVGSVAVGLVPSARGWDERARKSIVPSADSIGREFGERCGSFISEALGLSVDKWGKETPAKAGRTGEATGREFGTKFKATIEAALNDIPPVEIAGDDVELRAMLTRLREQLMDLRGRVEINPEEAQEVLSKIEAQMRALKGRIELDPAEAVDAVREVREQAARPVNMQITAGITEAEAEVAKLRQMASKPIVMPVEAGGAGAKGAEGVGAAGAAGATGAATREAESLAESGEAAGASWGSRFMGRIQSTMKLGGEKIEGASEKWGESLKEKGGEAGKDFGGAFSGILGTVMNGPAVAVAAGAAVAIFAVMGEKLDVAQKQLEGTMKLSGATWEEFGGKVKETGAKMSEYGYTQDAVDKSIRQVLQVTGNMNQALEAQQTIADVAASQHMSLAQAANTVTRAYAGNAKQLKLLGDTIATGATQSVAMKQAQAQLADQIHASGGMAQYAKEHHMSLAQAQKEVTAATHGNIGAMNTLGILVLPKSASAAERFTQVNRALEARMGGQAAIAADNFGGKIRALGARFTDAAESIGQKIMPYLEKLMDLIIKYTPDVENLVRTIAHFVAPAVSAFFKGLGDVFKLMTGPLKNVSLGILALAAAIGIVKLAIIAFEATTPFGWVLIAITAIITLVGVIDKYHRQIWNVIKATWDRVLSFMKQWWPVFLIVATGGVGAIAVAIIKYHNQIWNFIKETWDKVLNFIKQWWPLFLGVIIPGFGLLLGAVIKYHNQIWGFIQRIWNDVRQFFKGVWDDIVRIFVEIWNNMQHNVQAGLNFVRGIWNNVWNWVRSFFSGVWGDIVHIFVTAWDNYQHILQVGLNWLRGVWNTVWSWVRSFISGVWGDIQHIVGTAVSWLQHNIDNALQWIKGVWSAAWNWYASWADRIWGDITHGVGVAFNTIKSAFSSALGWIRNVWHDAFSWIESFVAGIWHGIEGAYNSFFGGLKSGFSAVVGAVKTIWSGLKDAVNAPMHFIIDTVYNGGIVRIVDDVAGVVGLHPLEPIKGFATGTEGAPPGWAWVGEEGPELVHMTGGERVLTTAQSMATGLWGSGPGFARGTNPDHKIPGGGQGSNFDPSRIGPGSEHGRGKSGIDPRKRENIPHDPLPDWANPVALAEKGLHALKDLVGAAMAKGVHALLDPLVNKIPHNNPHTFSGITYQVAKTIDDKLANVLATKSNEEASAGGGALAMLAFMMKQNGKRYSQASRFGPDSWDCSGLVWGAAHAAGVPMPGGPSDNSRAIVDPEIQWAANQPGAKIFQHPAVGSVKKGDLLGFHAGDDGTTGTVDGLMPGLRFKAGNKIVKSMGHIGMAMDSKMFMSAYDTAEGCLPKPIDYPALEAAVRMAGGGDGSIPGDSRSDADRGKQVIEFLARNMFSGNYTAAGGAAASMGGESSPPGWNPESVGSGGFGIMGWTPGYPAVPPQPTGNVAHDMAAQLRAIGPWVSASGDQGAIADMMKAGSIADAANIWGPRVERFGINDVHQFMIDRVIALLKQMGHNVVGGKVSEDDASHVAKKAADLSAELSKSGHAGAFANGTSSAPPGWAWVGERGPELMRFAGGETVLPNDISMAITRGFANGTDDVRGITFTRFSATEKELMAAEASRDTRQAALAKALLDLTHRINEQNVKGLTIADIKGDVGDAIKIAGKYYTGSTARHMENSFTNMGKAITAKLDQANKTGSLIGQAQNYANSVASGLGGTDISNLSLPAGGATGKNGGINIALAFNSTKDQLNKFAVLLNRARGKKINPGLLQQIVGLGPVQGAQMLSEILDGGARVIMDINDDLSAINKAQTTVGQAAANAVYGYSGTGKAFLAGLKAQKAGLDGVAIGMAKTFVDSLSAQIGGHDTGKNRLKIKAHAAGGSFRAGDIMLVGEEGPELISLGSDGTVIPNDAVPAWNNYGIASGYGRNIESDEPTMKEQLKGVETRLDTLVNATKGVGKDVGKEINTATGRAGHRSSFSTGGPVRR